jgi:hypothetical protein
MGRSSLISQSHLAAHASAPRPNPPQVTGVRTSVRLVPISLSLSPAFSLTSLNFPGRHRRRRRRRRPPPDSLRRSRSQATTTSRRQLTVSRLVVTTSASATFQSRCLNARIPRVHAATLVRSLASPTPIHDTSRAPPAWLLVKRRLTFTSSSPT